MNEQSTQCDKNKIKQYLNSLYGNITTDVLGCDDRQKRIAEHYQMETQIKKLAEECAELIQQCIKLDACLLESKGGGREELTKLDAVCKNFTEEFADVVIVMQELAYLFNHTDFALMLVKRMAQKLDRQIKRMEGKEDEENKL